MLRTVTEDDIDAIMHIVVAAGLFEPSDQEFLAGAVSEFVTTHSETAAGFLLDCDGDRAVGVVCWNPKVAADAVWDLTMIAVLPEYQGSGRGTAMMAHVENELVLAGQRLLLVETSSTEQYEGTRAFYRRCGYDEEARVRDYWSDGDDLVLFRKRLLA